MNDWNFFVREVGRGRGVQERSLEVTEVLRRVGGSEPAEWADYWKKKKK